MDVRDEQKANLLLSLLGDLDYVDAHAEPAEIIWKGDLPVFENPVNVPGFMMYARGELYDR